MARILIDESLCQGTKECAALAGDAIGFDDLGIAHAVDPDAQLPDDLAQRLAATCPSMAIVVLP